MPQSHTPPFPYLVRDVVLMGRTARLGPFDAPGKADRAAVGQALSLLGIAGLADSEYTRISGGQRQLVLIARALAQETPLLVMDEPTASLDFGNQALVLREVRRVAVLHDGRLAAQGAPEDVLTASLLREIYDVHVVIERLPGGQTVCAPDLQRPP